MSFQPAAVIFDDIELWSTGYLRAELANRPEAYAAGAYVSNKKPATNRRKTIVVRRDGGPQRGLFDFPRLTIRIWDDDERTASDLARLVQALMVVSPGHGPVVAVTVLSGPQGIPDDSQPQKLLGVELQTRGARL